YHHEDAAPWERVALLRSRPVWSARLGGAEDAGFPRLLAEITYQRPLDETALRHELQHMRKRIEDERAGDGDGSVHLRFSPGGLTDLEFMAAFEQLRRGRAEPALRTTAPYQ